MNTLHEKAVDLGCQIAQIHSILLLVANHTSDEAERETHYAVSGIAKLARQAEILAGEIECLANKPAGMVSELQVMQS